MVEKTRKQCRGRGKFMFSNKTNNKETNDTKLNKIKNTMSESEFLFRAQFEHANIGIALEATDGKWLKVNSKLCDILGYSREELLVMSWREITHLDDLKNSEERWRKMFDGEFDNYRLHKRFIKKDGSSAYVHLSTSCYRNEDGVIEYVMVYYKDVTKNRINEQIIHDNEAHIRALFEHAISGITFADSKGQYIMCNQAFADTVGYSVDELKYMDFRQLSVEEDLIKEEALLLEIIEQKRDSYRIEKRYCTKNGDIVWVDLSVSTIRNENGTIKNFIATCINISKRKSAEEELVKKHNELSMLYNLYNKASRYIELDEYLKVAQETVMNMLQADGIAVYLNDLEKKSLVLHSSFGFSTEFINDINQINFKNFVTKTAFKTGRPAFRYIDDSLELSYKDLMSGEGIKSVWSFPIISADNLLGVLTFVFKSNRIIDDKEKEFIQAICNQIAVLLQNVLLYERIRKELKKRRNKEEELEIFFDTAVDFMGISGFDGYFKRISSEWSKKLGWTEAEFLSKPFHEFLHPDDIKVTRDAISELANGKEVIGLENRYVCKDGGYRWIQWNSRAVVERNIIIGSARDITEQKELQEKAQELEKTIQLENLRSEFFANISHELRTPLNIILATLQVIQQKIENKVIVASNEEKLNIYLKGIKQNSYRLLRLMNNIIDTTKIDSGFMNLDLQNCNIVNIIEDITLSVAQFIEVKGLKLVFDTDIEEKIMACDPDKIERIILNLLSNAVKFTENEDSIFVNIYDKNDKIIIVVKDTGLGIAPDKVDIIFERFRQADKSLSRRCEGSGIGLSLVNSLVQMHGGTILVKSELGKGSEFIIELPVKLCDENCENEDVTDMARKTQIQKCNIEFSDIYSLQ